MELVVEKGLRKSRLYPDRLFPTPPCTPSPEVSRWFLLLSQVHPGFSRSPPLHPAPRKVRAGLCDVRLAGGCADQSGLEGVALHCSGGYIRRVPRALGQTASKVPIMEGGEGPAQPPTSETTSGKDKSADPRGRNKCSKCHNVSASFSFLRKYPCLGRLAWHGCPPQPTPFPHSVPFTCLSFLLAMTFCPLLCL